jgi:hypothetical protein
MPYHGVDRGVFKTERLRILLQRQGMITSLLVGRTLAASVVTDQNHGFCLDTNPGRIRCRRNSDPMRSFRLIDDGSATHGPHITVVMRFPKLEMML